MAEFGIRAALRWLWSQGLGGSSPLVRIVKIARLAQSCPVKLISPKAKLLPKAVFNRVKLEHLARLPVGRFTPRGVPIKSERVETSKERSDLTSVDKHDQEEVFGATQEQRPLLIGDYIKIYISTLSSVG